VEGCGLWRIPRFIYMRSGERKLRVGILYGVDEKGGGRGVCAEVFL